MAARDPSDVRLSNGERATLPAHLPACEGVRILRGKVVACVQDRRDRLDCRTFGAGTTIASQDFAAPGSGRGWLTSLVSLLQGEVGTVSGVTRGRDDGALPAGPVAFVAGGIVLDFTGGSLASAERVEFIDAASGAAILTAKRDGKRLLDAAPFEAGRSYQWIALSSTNETADSGRFTVVGANEVREARQQREMIATESPADSSARALMLAAWLQQRGLTFDARDTLRRAGFTRQKSAT